MLTLQQRICIEKLYHNGVKDKAFTNLDFFKDLVDKRVDCKQCEKKLVYAGGTTAMQEHMKRAHPLLIKGSEGESTKSNQSSLSNHVTMGPTQAPGSGTTSKEITGFLTD